MGHGLSTTNGLTPRQVAFVKHYIATPLAERNATTSALAAGYAAKHAASQGARLLIHVKIRAAILEMDVDRRIEINHVNDAWLLQEAANLWETPLSSLFDADGRLLPIKDLNPQAQRLISGFKVTQRVERVYREDGSLDSTRDVVVETVDIKLIDRLRVLDVIGRHTSVNAFGDREKSEAAGAFSDVLRALAEVVRQGGAIDAKLVQKLVGEGR